MKITKITKKLFLVGLIMHLCALFLFFLVWAGLSSVPIIIAVLMLCFFYDVFLLGYWLIKIIKNKKW